MGIDFHLTGMGSRFFESTLPRIATALERIADGMGDKKETKEGPLWACFVGSENGGTTELGPYVEIRFVGASIIGITEGGKEELLAGRQISTQGSIEFWWQIKDGNRYRELRILMR